MCDLTVSTWTAISKILLTVIILIFCILLYIFLLPSTTDCDRLNKTLKEKNGDNMSNHSRSSIRYSAYSVSDLIYFIYALQGKETVFLDVVCLTFYL